MQTLPTAEKAHYGGADLADITLGSETTWTELVKTWNTMLRQTV